MTIALLLGSLAAFLANNQGAADIGRVMLNVLVPLPLFLAVLSQGIVGGGFALLVASMLLATMTNPQTGIVFIGLIGFPVLLIGWVSLWQIHIKIKSQSISAMPKLRDNETNKGNHKELKLHFSWVQGEFITLTVTAVGFVLVLLMMLAIATTGTVDPQATVENFLMKYLALIEQEVSKTMALKDFYSSIGSEELVKQFIKFLAAFPSLLVVSWLILLTINGIVAQGLLMRFNMSLRPAPDLAQMSLPYWFSGTALVLGILSFAGHNWLGFLAQNLLLILIYGLVLNGLGIFHQMSKKWPMRIWILSLIYISMLFSSGMIFIPLIMAGVAQPFWYLWKKSESK